jgi:hypothetical protein
LFGADRVGFDDRCVEQVVQPAPGQLSHGRGGLGIHPAGLCGGQVPGRGSDVAGLVGRYLPGERGRANPGEPVPQVQRVCDQPGRRSVGDAQHTTQFGRTEARDGLGAVPAQLYRTFATGQPTLPDGVSGMDISPVSGDVESSGFGGDQGVFVGLGCG